MRISSAFAIAYLLTGCEEAPRRRPVEVPTTKLPNGAFDRESAAASIGAVEYQSCHDSNGPTGNGHMTFTFEPDGSVSKVDVDGGPYPGTSVAQCLVRLGLAMRMRPFDGPKVRVGKSFIIR